MKKGHLFLSIILVLAFHAKWSMAMEASLNYKHYWAVDQKGDDSYHSLGLNVVPFSLRMIGISTKPFFCAGIEYNRDESNFERVYGGAGISANFLDHFTGGVEIHSVKYNFNVSDKRQKEMARIIGEKWATEGELSLNVEYPFLRLMKSEIRGYAMDTFTYNFTENLGTINRVEAGIVFRILKKMSLSAGWRHEDILGGGPDADQIFIGLSF